MLLGLLSALTVAQTQPQHACHNGTRVLKSAGTSSCPDSSRWLQKVSRHWIGQETARSPEGNHNGCKVGKSWVKGGCHVTKPIVFLNIGANKGFAVAQMMQQFTLKPGFNNQDWLTAMGDYLMETYGVKQESLANFLPDYCGACRACTSEASAACERSARARGGHHPHDAATGTPSTHGRVVARRRVDGVRREGTRHGARGGLL